jgi:ApaG protein
MTTQITNGIKVSVVTRFLEDRINPEFGCYLFGYRIRIENNSDYTVQLLRRQWKITDSLAGHRIVEGEGVVGLQPVIAPGEFHEYESACELGSEMGCMEGHYQMIRVLDNHEFEIRIPRFELVAPIRLN